MKKYPETIPKPAVPGRRRRRSLTKSSSERTNTGVKIFNMNMEPKHKRHRRSFTDGEKARLKAVRKEGACKGCHDGKRRVNNHAHSMKILPPCLLTVDSVFTLRYSQAMKPSQRSLLQPVTLDLSHLHHSGMETTLFYMTLHQGLG